MTSKPHRLYLYYSTIFLSILGSLFFFHHLTVNQSADYLYVEKCILCAISSFFNLFVLYYHYTRAPHPKFLVLRKRRISIFIHIASGLFEFFACWVAFLAGSPRMATVAALAAICGHVPTSYYQTTIVFGSKAVMIAEYLFTISLHLFSAIRLLLEPTSVYWLLNMFLVHNIYVWVRVTYFLFRTVGVFKDSVYTGATLTSGMILFPAVLGVSANMLFLAFATLTILLYFVIVQPDETERVQFFNEGTRDVLVDKRVYETWINEQQRLATFAECDRLTDQQRAKQVFDDLDVNKDGKLDGEEITRLSKEWNVATSFIRRCKNQSKKSPLTFDLFYRNVWCRCEASTDIIDAGRQREVTAKARFVFKYLDPNHTGSVDRLELQKLLIQWGLPNSEADTYLSVHHEKKLSFNDFYSHFKPVWNFAYENLLVQDDGQVAQPVYRSDTK